MKLYKKTASGLCDARKTKIMSFYYHSSPAISSRSHTSSEDGRIMMRSKLFLTPFVHNICIANIAHCKAGGQSASG